MNKDKHLKAKQESRGFQGFAGFTPCATRLAPREDAPRPAPCSPPTTGGDKTTVVASDNVRSIFSGYITHD